jgi:hypothetical protein
LVIMLELLGDDGKQGANGSASAGSADDVKLTVQLVDALAHTGDTHAQRDLRGSVGNHVVDTNSVIFDFHPHGIRVAFDADTGGSGAGADTGRTPGSCSGGKEGAGKPGREASEVEKASTWRTPEGWRVRCLLKCGADTLDDISPLPQNAVETDPARRNTIGYPKNKLATETIYRRGY